MYTYVYVYAYQSVIWPISFPVAMHSLEGWEASAVMECSKWYLCMCMCMGQWDSFRRKMLIHNTTLHGHHIVLCCIACSPLFRIVQCEAGIEPIFLFLCKWMLLRSLQPVKKTRLINRRACNDAMQCKGPSASYYEPALLTCRILGHFHCNNIFMGHIEKLYNK